MLTYRKIGWLIFEACNKSNLKNKVIINENLDTRSNFKDKKEFIII